MSNNNTTKLSSIIKINETKCINCHACIRVCPSKHCNDGSKNQTTINPDLCIGCGRCIKVCSRNAREYIDDFSAFKNLLDQNEPIVVIVSPSIAANFPNQYKNLNGWLKTIGVDAVFDASFGAELTAKSYAEYIKNNNPEIVIAQPCPVIVTYIQTFLPELLKYLAPVNSPVIHTAKYIKDNFPQYNNHKIVVLSPCLAKRREFDETEPDILNVLHFSIQKYLEENNINLENFPEIEYETPHAIEGVSLSTPGGLTNALEMWVPDIKEKTRQIQGNVVFEYLNQVRKLKKTNAESLPLLIDCTSCSMGCNGGSLASRTTHSIDNAETNIRNRKEQHIECYKQTGTENADISKPIKEITNKCWNEDYASRKYVNHSNKVAIDEFDENIKEQIFRQMNKFYPEDENNCGACGYETCEAMAKAIYKGLNKPENCYNYLIKENKKHLEKIEQERNELKTLQKELENRVAERTKNLEEQKKELITSRKIALSLMEDSEQARQKLEEINLALEEQTKKAEMANEAKSSFLANMSHEIRTPLNGVIGFIQLLSETNLNDEQIELAMEAQKSSKLLISLVNDILDYSKIEAGKMSLEKIDFDFHSTIEEVVSLLASDAYKKDLAINILIAPEVPQYLVGDPKRLKQILNNLINNSIKFTTNGEIFIQIKLSSETDENANIELEISDTGIGISEKQLNKIFESFSQADPSTTRKYGGTGLGLTIVQKIVNLFEGEIKVISKINQGTTFKIKLPFKKSLKYISTEDFPNKKILIINNKPSISKILTEYLSSQSGELFIAESIEQAVELKESGFTPDTVIVEYNILDKEEIIATNILRGYFENPETNLILLKSIAQKNQFKEEVKDIFSHCLNLPIRKKDLLSCFCNTKQNINTDGDSIQHSSQELTQKYNDKILVVEDNEMNAKLITKMLEKQNAAYDIAKNGVEAINAFKLNKYGLILMDCQMPVLDGYQATKAIREIEKEYNFKSTPIIALTANALAEDREKCLQAGMDDYITKPIEKNSLISLINHFLSCLNINIEDIYQEIMLKTGFEKDEIEPLFKDVIDAISNKTTKIFQYIENNDYQELYKKAHTIKGMASNMYIKVLVTLSIKLEEAASNTDKQECIRITNQIKHITQIIDSSLESAVV